MEKDIKCSRCGSTKDVFIDSVFDSETNEINSFPICINCKKAKLEINNIIDWQNKLKKLELHVSKQLIDDNFSNIKFKRSAQLALSKLMETYSIRTVFEVCFGLTDFNIHKIEDKCKQQLVL